MSISILWYYINTDTKTFPLDVSLALVLRQVHIVKTDSNELINAAVSLDVKQL